MSISFDQIHRPLKPQHESTRAGACAHCRHDVRLVSFTAARQRVIDLCPHCSRARVVVHEADWHDDVERACARARAVFANEDASGASIVDAAAALALTSDAAAFDAVVAATVDGIVARVSGADDGATVIAGLARACLDGGQPQRAINLYQRALAVRRDDAIAEQLAYVHLLLVEPQKAQPLLEHIWRDGKFGSLPRAALLIDAWQTVADHDAALRVIALLTAAFPAEMRQREFAEQRAISERERRRQQMVFRRQLRQQAFPNAIAAAARGKPASMSVAERLVVVACVLAVAAGYVSLGWYEQQHHTVVLVSGAAHDYDVEVDGETLHLEPAVPVRRALGLGPHTVIVHAPSGETLRRDFDNSASLLRAPFESHHHILNPDSCAVFKYERVQYARSGDTHTEPSFTVMTGDLWYRLESDDFLRDYPASIARRDDRERTRIALTPVDAGPATVAAAHGQAAKVEFLRRRLAFDPGDDVAARELQLLVPGDGAAPADR